MQDEKTYVHIVEETECGKCFATYGKNCYYVNRGGNFTYLNKPHKERIVAHTAKTKESSLCASQMSVAGKNDRAQSAPVGFISCYGSEYCPCACHPERKHPNHCGRCLNAKEEAEYRAKHGDTYRHALEIIRSKFTEDDIRRDGLPKDVFELIHDLAYDHDGRDRRQYRDRAQMILCREGFSTTQVTRERLTEMMKDTEEAKQIATKAGYASVSLKEVINNLVTLCANSKKQLDDAWEEARKCDDINLDQPLWGVIYDLQKSRGASR